MTLFNNIDDTLFVGKTIERVVSERMDVVQLFFTDGTTVKLAVHDDNWTQMGPMIVVIEQERS